MLGETRAVAAQWIQWIAEWARDSARSWTVAVGLAVIGALVVAQASSGPHQDTTAAALGLVCLGVAVLIFANLARIWLARLIRGPGRKIAARAGTWLYGPSRITAGRASALAPEDSARLTKTIVGQRELRFREHISQLDLLQIEGLARDAAALERLSNRFSMRQAECETLVSCALDDVRRAHAERDQRQRRRMIQLLVIAASGTTFLVAARLFGAKSEPEFRGAERPSRPSRPSRPERPPRN